MQTISQSQFFEIFRSHEDILQTEILKSHSFIKQWRNKTETSKKSKTCKAPAHLKCANNVSTDLLITFTDLILIRFTCVHETVIVLTEMWNHFLEIIDMFSPLCIYVFCEAVVGQLLLIWTNLTLSQLMLVSSCCKTYSMGCHASSLSLTLAKARNWYHQYSTVAQMVNFK